MRKDGPGKGRSPPGEDVPGTLLNRAHVLPPHGIGRIVADVVAGPGGRDVAVLLQDHGQRLPAPLRIDGLLSGNRYRSMPRTHAWRSRRRPSKPAAPGITTPLRGAPSAMCRPGAGPMS